LKVCHTKSNELINPLFLRKKRNKHIIINFLFNRVPEYRTCIGMTRPKPVLYEIKLPSSVTQ